MVETERDDQRLRHLQAHAAAHLISGFKIDAINSAVSLRFEIQELIDAYPDEPELRGSFADATENLVGVVLPADIASAQQRYAELRNLAVSYPAEPGLRHSQAKVAERLMHEFSSKKLLSEAESLQADVRKLAEQFPDDQELRYALATSIIHMIDIVAPTDLASAKTHYTKVQQFKDIPLLGSWLASVAHDLFKRCIRKGEANTALAMQDDLRDLAETYPNDTLIKRYLEWSEEELRKSDAPQAKDTPS
jgi:hypothetical protein